MNNSVGLPALLMLCNAKSPPKPTRSKASDPMRTPMSHFLERIWKAPPATDGIG